jgi:quercetin dioxygenase-like cupin family protein
MADPGDVLEAPTLGLRMEFRHTTAETGGELVEFDLIGRPKGILATPHVHPSQTERQEVIEGSLAIRFGPLTRTLAPGDVVETPAGTVHLHKPDGRIRVQIRPALAFEAWAERLAAMDRAGDVLPGGWPRPVAGAKLLLEFPGEARMMFPPDHVQQATARAIVGVADKVGRYSRR